MITKPAREVLESIKSILAGRGPAEGPAFVEVANDWDAVVGETSRRLAEVTALLDKGYRAEALRLCAMGSDLVDEIRCLLDGGVDLAPWQELLTKNSRNMVLDIDPNALKRLPTERALHETFQKDEVAYRRAALARLSIESRLSLVTHLHTYDPNNPAWREDAELLERAWIRQLTNAPLPESVAELDALRNKLASIQGVSDALTNRVEQTLHRARALGKEQRRKALEQEIGKAVSAQDGPVLTTLVARWVAEFKGAPESSVIQAAKRLVAERAALNELHAAIAEMKDATRLDRAWHSLEILGASVPDDVARTYQRTRHALGARASRTYTLKIVALVLVVISVGLGVAFTVQQRSSGLRVDEMTDQLSTLIKQRKWSEAEDVLSRVAKSDASLVHEPKLMSISTAITMHAERLALFKKTQSRIMAMPVLERTPSTMAELAALSDDDSCDLIVRKMNEEIATAQAQVVHELDQNIDRVISGITSGIRDSSGGSDEEIAAVTRKGIDALRTADADMRLSAERHAQIRTLISKYTLQLEQAETRIATQKKRIEDASTLVSVAATGSIPDYISAVNAFLQQYPEQGGSNSVTSLMPIYRGIADWNAYVARHRDLLRVTVLGDRLTALDTSLDSILRSPYADAVKQYRDLLVCIEDNYKAIIRRSAMGPELDQFLHDDDAIARLLVIRDPTTQEAYYLRANQKVGTGEVNGMQFCTFIRFDPEEKDPKALNVRLVVSARDGLKVSWATERAPHCLLAERIIGIYQKGLTIDTTRDAIELTLTANQVDAPQRMQFLQKLIRERKTLWPPLDEAFVNAVESWSPPGSPWSWLNPKGDQYVVDRASAERVLRSLPSLPDRTKTVEALAKSLIPQRPIGIRIDKRFRRLIEAALPGMEMVAPTRIGGKVVWTSAGTWAKPNLSVIESMSEFELLFAAEP